MASPTSYWKNVVILLVTTGCLERYDPPVSNDKVSFLVVDGFINISSQTASVKLTTAIGLSETESIPYVAQANVSVEDENGNAIPLSEKGKGNYEITSAAFTINKKYRLHIQLSDGRKYQSDYVQPLAAPPIDNITWKGNNTGTTIYVNTHDDTNATRYYKWKYTETWSYTSLYYSYYKVEGGQAIYRTPEENIYYCWGNEPSTAVLVNSTTQLDKDVVRDFPLTIVPKGSRKLSKIYSILVEQSAIDENAYEYWTKLQKTTESLGGLFDPLPSQVIGNIHRDNNASETVLGYFSASSVQQKRIFINFYDLPGNLLVFNYGVNCLKDGLKADKVNELPPNQLIIESYGLQVIEGYVTATAACVDCRTFGGTTTKPDFWPW